MSRKKGSSNKSIKINIDKLISEDEPKKSTKNALSFLKKYRHTNVKAHKRRVKEKGS